MTEERRYATPTPNNNHVHSKENQVKVNFTFEVPLTDALREKLGESYSPGKLAMRLNKLVGESLSAIARKDNAFFEGRFVVTDINVTIKGVYFSQSMIRTSTETKLLTVLRERLKEMCDTTAVNAEINLDCYF